MTLFNVAFNCNTSSVILPYVCVHAQERVHVRVCVSVHMRVCACAYLWVCLCVRVSVYVRVYESSRSPFRNVIRILHSRLPYMRGWRNISGLGIYTMLALQFFPAIANTYTVVRFLFLHSTTGRHLMFRCNTECICMLYLSSAICMYVGLMEYEL